ncbi:MAG: AIR synthase-related protein, partial [Acidobacteriota bacterium]
MTKEARIKKQELRIRESKNQTKTLTSMLQRLNITSFEFISQQYDHIVQGNAVLGPLQGRGRVNADTSVFRPILSSQKGVVMSQSLYPTYTEINPYNMTASCIDTAIRNLIASGANPDAVALLDNYCWCSSNDPERLGQLKASAQAVYDYAVAYGTPYISGKDSMFNDFKGFDEKGKPITISILPTLLISSVGVIDDITKVVSLYAKIPGDLVYILGETQDELAGSEYFKAIHAEGTSVPSVNAQKNQKLYQAVYKAIQNNLLASSISITRGGLGIGLAKKAIGGQLGLAVSLQKLPGDVSRDDFALYSESQGRILVTVAKENKTAFEKMLQGNSFALIG